MAGYVHHWLSMEQVSVPFFLRFLAIGKHSINYGTATQMAVQPTEEMIGRM